MTKMIDGVEQLCCLCNGQAGRHKVQDTSAYDVNCGACGSYRIGRAGELAIGRTTYLYRESVANRIRAANRIGLIFDLTTGHAFVDKQGRLPE